MLWTREGRQGGAFEVELLRFPAGSSKRGRTEGEKKLMSNRVWFIKKKSNKKKQLGYKKR